MDLYSDTGRILKSCQARDGLKTASGTVCLGTDRRCPLLSLYQEGSAEVTVTLAGTATALPWNTTNSLDVSCLISTYHYTDTYIVS